MPEGQCGGRWQGGAAGGTRLGVPKMGRVLLWVTGQQLAWGWGFPAWHLTVPSGTWHGVGMAPPAWLRSYPDLWE